MGHNDHLKPRRNNKQAQAKLWLYKQVSKTPILSHGFIWWNRDSVYQVWKNLTYCYWRKRLLYGVKKFSLSRYYFHLEKLLDSPSSRILYVNFNLVDICKVVSEMKISKCRQYLHMYSLEISLSYTHGKRLCDPSYEQYRIPIAERSFVPINLKLTQCSGGEDENMKS